MFNEEAGVQVEEQLVVFGLTQELYGVDIGRVQEIIRMQTITEVPRAPEFVEGVINLRGGIIPVIDLRKRFGMAHDDHDKETRIVVVEMGGQRVGLVVDRVSEVLRVPKGNIEPPSALVTTVESAYLRAIAKLEDRLIILLDLDRVLRMDEQALLQSTDLPQAA
ncbi:MAG: chemotaxis protein CheW [Chloroflexi bacterium]|nr:chemotaxis protein CheW [Chloroflexota bacterium]